MVLLVPDFVVNPIESVLQTATSRTAQKTYIRTILATCLATVLLIFAGAGYVLFYLNYVPQIGYATPIQMTYGFVLLFELSTLAKRRPTHYFGHFIMLNIDTKPWGVAAIPRGVLIHNQPYDVHVVLTMPTTKRNYDVGNFMINVTFMDTDSPDSIGYKGSKRTARLTHRSTLISTVRTLFWSPLYLTGLRREEEVLRVLMQEGESFAKGAIPNYVGIHIGNDVGTKPEAYEVDLELRAKFRGLRYIMYNHRIISFVFFTTLFWMTEVFWALLAWAVISFVFGSSSSPDASSSSPLSTMKVDAKGAHASSLQEREDDYGYRDDNRMSLTSAAKNSSIYPLAPADDDSDSMSYPRDRYIKSEDIEEDLIKAEMDSDDTSPDELRTNTVKLERDGFSYDSGVGSSVGESTGRDDRGGVLKKRRSSRG